MPHRMRSLVLCATSTTIVLAALLYSALPERAVSQIESRKVSAPNFSYSSSHAEKSSLPKAPAQVDMPTPPPMKIFPGLEEPLVATGPVTDAEGKELDAALVSFHQLPLSSPAGSDYSDYAKPLEAFITAHPQSNWNAALYTDLGLGYYHAGYYTKAFPAFENAWKLGRNASTPQAHRMIDRAVGELAGMHARVGHAEELEALLADVGARPIAGPATELFDSARGGLTGMKNHPETAYLCGPMALKNVLITLKAGKKQIKVAEDARSGLHGFSLAELATLATKAKLKYTLIRRAPGQPVPVPSIVNWNVHHYAAIVGTQDGLYRMADPTFANRVADVVTSKTLDSETTGYYLVPDSVMKANPKAGWQIVSAQSQEARDVYGMGIAPGTQIGSNMATCASCSSQMPANTPMNNSVTSPPASKGALNLSNLNAAPQMTIPDPRLSTVDLAMSDTPVGYRPQIGIPALTRITYNARDDIQPANIPFSNVSPKWTHSWMLYVEDNPGAYQYIRAASGGGGYQNNSTATYFPEPSDSSLMTRTPASGTATSYTRTLPDGGKEVYGLSNGATTYPRFMFMTSITDAQGNTTTLNYDATFRLTSLTDAMGRSTTFTYGLAAYPLLITKITDPFSRTSQLTYDTSERLASITDPVGITSTFTYSTTEPSFISQLATPYGNTTFNDTVNPNDPAETATRSLTTTDPLGNIDYLYFYQSTAAYPLSDPASTFPTSPGFINTNLSYRNTYHWNPHQTTLGATFTAGVPQSEDFTKATVYHFYHFELPGAFNSQVSNQLASMKSPLENRIWFNNFGSMANEWTGSLDAPIMQGRVLDDGTTQQYSAAYPENSTSQWIVSPYATTQTDPMGRVTLHNYATNNIDLLTVQQETASSPVTYTTIATYGSYTTQHEPQTYTDAAGQIWNYTYDTVGQIKTVKDPLGHTTTYNYDTTGRLSTVVDTNSVTILTLTYDADDRVATRTDSQGYVLTYAYDNLDRVTKITYPDATTDLYDYTFQTGPLAGTQSLELRKHTDRLSRVTTYGYDADRRLTSVVEPTSGTATRTTSYDYYEDGTLKDIIDADNNDTRWAIDLQSRPVSKTYQYGTASAKTETYAYENTTSRLHSITDALGQVKTFTYAKDNRVTGITYTSSVNTTPNVTFAWDPYFPRLTSMADGTGTTTYGYAAIGTNGALKLTSVNGAYSNDNVLYAYDTVGRLSARTNLGGDESFGYDTINRLNSHVTPMGTFTYGYLGETDQVNSRSVINGSVTLANSWGYDTNTYDRHLISITNPGVTRSFAISYVNGTTHNPYDIQSIGDNAATGHPYASQTHSYGYDLRDRVLTASATTPGNSTFAYDKLDNATTYTQPPTASVSPTYNGFNQISTWGTLTYAYDANGNLTSGDGTKTYKYDAENRVIEIDYVGGTNKSVFTYDGMGHRISDAETVSGTTTTSRYTWCGDRLCQTRTSGDVIQRLDYAEGEYNVTTGQKLVYAQDQIGSVRDVLDATTGGRVASYDYTPYGAVARSSVTNGTDYQYAGLFKHAQSGLNMARYRFQDGATGRWVNRDPVSEYGGLNLYSYVSAMPNMDRDPMGLCATSTATAPDPCGTPTSLVILSAQTKDMGTYTLYFYQLEGPNGNPLTGSGYSGIEHVVPAPETNTNGRPISIDNNGVISDRIGFTRPQTQNVSHEYDQTFTVMCGGKIYPLTTELLQIHSYINGVYNNFVTVIQP